MVVKQLQWIAFVVTATLAVLVCHTTAQITVMGSEEVNYAPLWTKKIHHFPNMGTTFFFHYEIKITNFISNKFSAVQLEPHVTSYVKYYNGFHYKTQQVCLYVFYV